MFNYISAAKPGLWFNWLSDVSVKGTGSDTSTWRTEYTSEQAFDEENGFYKRNFSRELAHRQ